MWNHFWESKLLQASMRELRKLLNEKSYGEAPLQSPLKEIMVAISDSTAVFQHFENLILSSKETGVVLTEIFYRCCVTIDKVWSGSGNRLQYSIVSRSVIDFGENH